MKQKQYQPLSVAEMALSLFAVNEGYVDDVPANKVVDFEAALHAYARANFQSVLDGINANPEFNDQVAAEMKNVIESFKKTGTY
jgi:F-type H+-transporting ATPase subunit alpha